MVATANSQSIGARDRAADSGGHVFGRITTIALAVLIGAAAWFRQPAVVTVLGLTLATIGVSRVWSKLSLRRVRCERTLSSHALFPGDELVITMRLSNEKLLPLPWIEVAQQLPQRLLGRRTDSADGNTMVRSLAMPWYSRLTWKQSVRPKRRGYYYIPPLTVTSGDILGLYPREMEGGRGEDLAVYPQLYPVRSLPLQRADATGALTGRLSLYEDPTRVRGVRDYQPRDGMRRVHWKSSARHGDLKVRLYEPAALSRVHIALSADGFGEFSDSDPFELATSAVASVACYCVEHQMQVGFLSNAKLIAGPREARLSPGSGNAHLAALLELLARATPSLSAPFEHLASELRRAAFSGSGLIIVVGRLNEQHASTFASLSAGRCPLLVLTSDTSLPHQPTSFPCRHLVSSDGFLDLGGA